MLTYSMEERGRMPLYDYLSRRIKADIWAGKLKPGERLPSKRALARNLEVSVATVENAYAQLVAEGYLYAKEKSGYYVSPLETQARPPVRPEPQPTEPEPQSWLLDLKGEGSGTEGFPFAVWARLLRRVISDEGERLLRVSPHSGVEELRRAIVGYLRQFRGVEADPAQVVVGAGTEYLYNLIVQLLGRERVYGVEVPGYPKAGKIYALNGARCVGLELDSQGVRVEQLEQKGVQVVHVSPSHQFPSGVVTPVARRQSLLRWAAEGEGRYIIEDDYDSEFRFTGRPIPTLQSIDRGERVIYMNTFSRTLAPSLRISYMVLPRGLLEQYQQKLGFYSCTVPAMEQFTLARFLSQGSFETHVNRMRVFYRARRDQVLSALDNSPLAGRYQVRGEDAGLHFLVRLDTRLPDGELSRRARERGIRLSFLTDYGGGEEHCLVVNYPGVDLARLPQALGELAQLLT